MTSKASTYRGIVRIPVISHPGPEPGESAKMRVVY